MCRKPTILVIDTNVDCADALAMFINYDGLANAIQVYDPSHVVPLLDSIVADVICTELRMYPIDGFRLLAAARARHPEVMFAALTASPTLTGRAFQAGFDVVLAKPSDPRLLTEAALKRCRCTITKT